MNLATLARLLVILRRLRQHEHWSREQIAAHQDRSLQALRADVYARSPFYQSFHRGHIGRPLSELPVLTKALMMEHFDELVTDELVTDRAVHLADVREHIAQLHGDEQFLGRYWVNATSGSSGHPGLFLFNRSEWLMVLASFARAREWAGVHIDLTHRAKLAIVSSTVPTHMSARAGATLHSWWVPELRLAASEPLATIVARLNAWAPEMLVAYASMAHVLAEEQLAGRLRITPQQVFTSSEVLTADARRRIAAAWGNRLFNQYAATETGELAAECEAHQGMHLFEDLVIAEVVDAKNQPVPPGEHGEKVLLTCLFNRTQPLIRYELTDSLRLSAAPCACGRAYTLIDGIQGRTDDTLQLPGRSGGPVAVHPIVFHQVMDHAAVSGWQIVQEPQGLTVLVSGAREGFASQELAAALGSAVAGVGVAVPPITVRSVTAIPQTAAGKAPLIRALPPRQEGVGTAYSPPT